MEINEQGWLTIPSKSSDRIYALYSSTPLYILNNDWYRYKDVTNIQVLFWNELPF